MVYEYEINHLLLLLDMMKMLEYIVSFLFVCYIFENREQETYESGWVVAHTRVLLFLKGILSSVLFLRVA